MKTYYAPGKVLLAGEYLVIKGMEALAFPVKLGQWLKVWSVDTQGNSKVVWEAKNSKGETWFKAEIDSDIMHANSCSDEAVAIDLVHLLQVVKSHKPQLFEHKTYRMETECEFPTEYGLGSSSTLVVMLAQWAQIDPFLLQHAVFGGSGYDVAVCQTAKPVVYWLENETPCWSPFALNPEWTSDWFLCFPGQKQNSRHALEETQDKIAAVMQDPLFKWQLDQILKGLKSPGSKVMLEAGLEMWQGILATVLGLQRSYDDLGISPIQGGVCKYLGAWGGDILLVNQTILDAYPQTFESMHKESWNGFVELE